MRESQHTLVFVYDKPDNVDVISETRGLVV